MHDVGGATFWRVVFTYGVSLAAFLGLDNARITLGARRLRDGPAASVMVDGPSVAPAFTFYLLYLVGLSYFAVEPGLRAHAPGVVVVNGAAYGFVAYLLYGLTNLARPQPRPGTSGTMGDAGWGAALSAVAGLTGFYATVVFAG